MTFMDYLFFEAHQQPFLNPDGSDTYYCKFCQTYSDDFYPSAIEEQYPRCRPCHNLVLQKKKQSLTPIEVLIKKLKSNLIYHKQHKMARAIKRDHVIKILEDQGVGIEHINKVKTISCCYDPIHDTWKFKLVFTKAHF